MRSLVLLGVGISCFARQVAVTIDDLPFVGTCDEAAVRQFTSALLKPGIPLTGFVIGSRCAEIAPGVLKMWTEAGATLGNHTWSHADLNSMPAAEYEADIVKGEARFGGRAARWFRHPFLHAGADAATKGRIDAFLARRGYRVAPVTLDNSDYMFAAVYAAALERGDPAEARRVRAAYIPYLESIFDFFERRAVEVAGHEIPQVMLLHASRLNAEAMPDLIRMMRGRGYAFVTLEEALRDEAYRLPDRYIGTGGFSWIHRWSKTKGMAPKGEPDEPGWIGEAWRKLWGGAK